MASAEDKAERRQHLKAYISACVRDSDLSWDDLLASPDKFLRILSMDVKIILKEAGRTGSVNLLRASAMMLVGFAEKLVAGNRR